MLYVLFANTYIWFKLLNACVCVCVYVGCCEWWMKRSKRVGTLELDRVRKSMSVIVREPTGQNRLLVKVIINKYYLET